MKIGLDLDNTIVCYDKSLQVAAQERNLTPPTAEKDIRKWFKKSLPAKAWTELQGTIYGPLMYLANPFSYLELFLTYCLSKNHLLFIISHKTKTPSEGPPYDLHEYARQWLKNYSFLKDIPVFFEPTVEDKIQRIHSLRCSCFIDDLPLLLLHHTFCPNIKKILFDPHNTHPNDSFYAKISSWKEALSLV